MAAFPYAAQLSANGSFQAPPIPAYNLGAGVVLFKIYTRWAHGFPWNHADYWGLVGIELIGALLLWGCLGVLAGLGIRRILRDGRRSATRNIQAT